MTNVPNIENFVKGSIDHCSHEGGSKDRTVPNAFPQTETALYRAVLTTVPQTEAVLYMVALTTVPTTEVALYRAVLTTVSQTEADLYLIYTGRY